MRRSGPQFFVLALLGTLCVVSGCNRNISDKKIEFIDLNRAVELHEAAQAEPTKALFIDARNADRFAAGHIQGARNIRVNEIDPRYEADPELLKYDNLVVYGENPASATARALAKRMIASGYNTMFTSRVRLYQGGWIVWDSSGLPVERDVVETDQTDTEAETGSEQ